MNVSVLHLCFAWLTLLSVGLVGCAKGQVQTPAPTVDFIQIREATKRHDQTASELRTFVFQQSAKRAFDKQWTSLKLGSITDSGMAVSGSRSLLELTQDVYQKAELQANVQAELKNERTNLTVLDLRVRFERIDMEALASKSALLGAALPEPYAGFLRAMDEELSVLKTLLSFYESDNFVRKGDRSEEFMIELRQAPARLVAAASMWEVAKLRAELLQQR